jgi:HEAT repeat protein
MGSEQTDRKFAETLSGDYDDDLPWKAVHDLRQIGSREVFDRAADWSASENPLERARGVDVLAQLGRTTDHPSNNFPDESFAIVAALVPRERDPLPLLSAIHALGHIGNPLAVPLVVAHRFHSDSDVRLAVAFALGKFADDPAAVEAMLALMQDADERVRDWATFGLAEIGDADSDEIRNALCARLTDPNDDVREGALVGLGKRKDRRVVPILIAELNQPESSDRIKEAAEFFMGENEHRADWSPSDYVVALQRHF